MARTRIGSKLIAVGGIHRDNVGSGSVEIGHLNFVASEGAASWGGVLADGDVLAVHDTSADTVRGIELADLKSYMSSSAVAGTSGSIQFNSAGAMAGHLKLMTDGNSLTASNAMTMYFAEKGAYTASLSTPRIHGGKLESNTKRLFISAGGGGLNENGKLIFGVTGSNGSSKSKVVINHNSVLLDAQTDIELKKAGTSFGWLELGNAGAANGLDITAGDSTGGSTGLKLNVYQAGTGYEAFEFGNHALGTGRQAMLVPSSGAVAFRDTGSYIYSNKAGDMKMLTVGGAIEIEAGGAIGGELVLDAQKQLLIKDGSAKNLSISYFTITGAPQRVIADGRDEYSGTGFSGNYFNVRFVGANSLPKFAIYSGSTAVQTWSAENSTLNGTDAKLYFDNGTTYYVGSTSNLQYLTASAAYIKSLEVDELVSRTVTKNSLEIKDNLIIAGASGSTPGDYVGAGFQLGGKVGVSGTGSLPLMSLTLGSRVLTGDALIVNVDGQAGASFASGSDTMAAVGAPGMRFGVTGSVSGSLLQAKRAELGHVSVGKVSGVALIGSTSVSGATGNFHDLTGDDCSFGGIAASSITASNGVILGSSNADDLSFLGGQITDLIPQNDNKVALGSATKRYTLISAMSASIAGAVGVVGAVTAGGTISGSAVTTHEVTTNKLHGTGIVTQDNMQTGSVLTSAILDSAVTAGKIGALAVTKAKLNQDIVINKTDANGGLTFTSGRLSVGWRKDVFVRADGSNISGTVPTHGMYATKAIATPYTTASLGAQPQSGSLMVYLNGVLLHGDHVGVEDAGRNLGEADYHLLTGSANAYKVLLHENLAIDSDDILTVTYLSGSGTNS